MFFIRSDRPQELLAEEREECLCQSAKDPPFTLRRSLILLGARLRLAVSLTLTHTHNCIHAYTRY